MNIHCSPPHACMHAMLRWLTEPTGPWNDRSWGKQVGGWKFGVRLYECDFCVRDFLGGKAPTKKKINAFKLTLIQTFT